MLLWLLNMGFAASETVVVAEPVTEVGGPGKFVTVSTQFEQQSAAGTKTAEVDWTGAGHEALGAIIVFTAVEE